MPGLRRPDPWGTEDRVHQPGDRGAGDAIQQEGTRTAAGLDGDEFFRPRVPGDAVVECGFRLHLG